MPFLSVLIPVYNGEDYLADAIESALNQPCDDLEVVVANDGSTDRSLEIARGYEELWSTILVPSVIITVLALFAFKTRIKWLYFIATAIELAGAVLLVGFPSYAMFLAFILGGLSLVAEIFWLATWCAKRKRNK